jgi:hypothetical protein
VKSVRRLEAKLDRMAAAMTSPEIGRPEVAGATPKSLKSQTKSSPLTDQTARSNGHNGQDSKASGQASQARQNGTDAASGFHVPLASAVPGQGPARLSREDSTSTLQGSEPDASPASAPRWASPSRSLSVFDQPAVQEETDNSALMSLHKPLPDTECEAMEPADKMEAMDLKIDGMDKKIERIALAVGARLGTGVSEEEDRRRLKEKLKEALESAQRNQMQHVESEKEVWLEYIFGICKPDGRIGKMGSRRVSGLMSVWERERTFSHPILRLRLASHLA